MSSMQRMSSTRDSNRKETAKRDQTKRGRKRRGATKKEKKYTGNVVAQATASDKERTSMRAWMDGGRGHHLDVLTRFFNADHA